MKEGCAYFVFYRKMLSFGVGMICFMAAKEGHIGNDPWNEPEKVWIFFKFLI